jgi:hypothetical protein
MIVTPSQRKASIPQRLVPVHVPSIGAVRRRSRWNGSPSMVLLSISMS